MDIYDIPITQLTNDFLAYIRQMELLNIELASEFMLVAATLMRVKAKMLLPRKELDEAGEEIDPRKELAERLLEYKRFKEVVQTLEEMELDRLERHERMGGEYENRLISDKYATEAELESLNLYKLMNVFNRVMERFREREEKLQYSIVRPPYTIGQQKKHLRNFLLKNKTAAFADVFKDCNNRIMAIFRFLAMLEMMNERLLRVRLGLGINNFWVSAITE